MHYHNTMSQSGDIHTWTTTANHPRMILAHEIKPNYTITEDVAAVLDLRYRTLVPIFVSLALVSNLLILYVTRRPNLNNLYVNQ